GQRCQNLIGVHVRRGSRTCLEHVDGEVSIVLTGDDRVGGVLDGRGASLVEDAELEVGLRSSLLHLRQGGDMCRLESFSGDREVLDRPLSLCIVEGVVGALVLSHGGVFDAILFAHCCPFRCAVGEMSMKPTAEVVEAQEAQFDTAASLPPYWATTVV